MLQIKHDDSLEKFWFEFLNVSKKCFKTFIKCDTHKSIDGHKLESKIDS